MATWLALLVAPILALADQSIAFAATGWACARQGTGSVHFVHALFLAATLAATFLAWQSWRAGADVVAVDESGARRHFLAGLAFASAMLSALTIAAMWLPTWLLSPCLN